LSQADLRRNRAGRKFKRTVQTLSGRIDISLPAVGISEAELRLG